MDNAGNRQGNFSYTGFSYSLSDKWRDDGFEISFIDQHLIFDPLNRLALLYFRGLQHEYLQFEVAFIALILSCSEHPLFIVFTLHKIYFFLMALNYFHTCSELI